MKFTRNQKIAILIATPVLIFMLTRFRYNLSLPKSIVIALASDLLFILSSFFEKRSDQKAEKLQNDMEKGGYGHSVEWKEKYAEFVCNKGFETVKYSAMKKDLIKRYIRPTGFFTILFAAVVLVLGVCLMTETVAKLFFGAVFLMLFAYGIYCLSTPNVRKFLKRCGSDYSVIENSYIGGKQLTCKKLASDKYCNDGINIGSAYVVIFTPKEVVALKYSDITDVKHRILRTKYYGNDVYTGTVYTHHIDVTARDQMNGEKKTFSAQLDEFKAELACRTLSERSNAPQLANGARKDY